MKLLLLLFAIVVEGMLDCPKYIASDKLGTDICTNDRESSPVVRPSLYIRPCKENQYCDPSTGLPFKCKDIDPKPAPNRHHGEICTANGECISEACKDGFCTAKVADGEKCTDTRECAVGSYCKGTPPEQKNCTKLIAVGEDCTGPFQCVQSSVCNKGKCVRKGSLRDGDEANNADACTSKALNASNTGCGRGLKLAYFNGTNGPVACSGEKASYLDSEDKIIEMPCMCGYNPNGVPYSPIYSGDLDVSDFWTYVRTAAEEKMHVTCFPFCYIKQAKDLKNDYYKAYLINAKLGSWPMFMDNSDTIKKMYTKAFWDIEDIINPKPKPDPGNGDSGSSSTTYIIIGVVCGVVVIAGIIVAIIIIRKRGSKGESLM